MRLTRFSRRTLRRWRFETFVKIARGILRERIRLTEVSYNRKGWCPRSRVAHQVPLVVQKIAIGSSMWRSHRRVYLLQSFSGLSSRSPETDATAEMASGNVTRGSREVDPFSARPFHERSESADKYEVLLKRSGRKLRGRKKKTQVLRSYRGIHLRRGS